MPLDKQQIETLLSAVSRTCAKEIHCGECLAGMAEFAELELVGAEIPQALHRIQEHLALCPECAEEYEVLLDVVRCASARAAGIPAQAQRLESAQEEPRLEAARLRPKLR
jgi:predicted anti-sigma-YlaC factor YlaD